MLVMRRIISWTPPNIAINPFYLPRLETIRDQELLKQSRTTLSWIKQEKISRNQGHQKGDNEERDHFHLLEWLGDAVLYQHSTEILMKQWSTMPVGSLARARGLLTRNITLSYLACHLGLYQKVRHTGLTGDQAASTQSLAADSFEAYIGALHKDGQSRGNPNLARDWLGKLWVPKVFPNLAEVAESKHLTYQVREKGVDVTESVDQFKGTMSPPNVQAPNAAGAPTEAKELSESRISMAEVVPTTQPLKTGGIQASTKKVDVKSILVENGGTTTTKVPAHTKKTEQSGSISSESPSFKPKEGPKAAVQVDAQPQGDQSKKVKNTKAKKVLNPPVPTTPKPKSKKQKKQPILA